MRVSIITAALNGVETIENCIKSVISQTYENLEYIIIDGGSTDGTLDSIRAYDNKISLWISEADEGIYHALNKGLRLASGDVIGFLDADDLWCHGRLEIQLGLLAQDPELMIVLGQTQLLRRADGRGIAPTFEIASDPWFCLSLGSGSFRRAVFQQVGMFDQQLRYADDLDWFMRAREAHTPMLIHREGTLLHRRHERNLTNQRERDNHYWLRMLKKSIDRRRQSGDAGSPMTKFSAHVNGQQ